MNSSISLQKKKFWQSDDTVNAKNNPKNYQTDRYIPEFDIIPRIKIRANNSFSFQELMNHYKDVEFVYPEKERRINKHLALIKKNWDLAWKAGRKILWTTLFEDVETKRIGSVTTWRHTNNGWFAQHLTSTGYPAGVCAMLLNTQAEAISKHYHSGQNWYSPTNKYARKLYGNMVSTVGSKFSEALSFNYFMIKPNNIPEPIFPIKTFSRKNISLPDFFSFVEKTRSKIYLDVEQFEDDDIELNRLSEIYKKFSLDRKRFVHLAYDKKTKQPIFHCSHLS